MAACGRTIVLFEELVNFPPPVPRADTDSLSSPIIGNCVHIFHADQHAICDAGVSLSCVMPSTSDCKLGLEVLKYLDRSSDLLGISWVEYRFCIQHSEL